MKLITGKGKKSQNKFQRRRNGLLAKVHIAVKELGVLEEDYRDILRREYGVASAANLSEAELEDLVGRFEACGWKPKRAASRAQRVKGQRSQAEALRKRARALVSEIENGERRLAGLCKKICEVDSIEWCNDTGKLKRLLVALGKIVVSEIQKK